MVGYRFAEIEETAGAYQRRKAEQMKITALIMAGGRGERFWPRSRKNFPKQFLSLTNDGRSMLQLTVDRILPLTAIEDVFIVTNRDYKSLVKEQLPGIPDENMPFVFDKFYRGTNCGGEQGAGLGLYIVKYIIGEMGGTVALQNHENGLEVKISLPTAYQSQISQSS